MKKNDNIYIGLDIGESKICAALCELKDTNTIELLGIGTSVCSGLSLGIIHDTVALGDAIQKAIHRAKQDAGATSDKIILNVPALCLDFIQNTGLLVSKSETGQITEIDQKECIKRSKNIAFSSDKTLLHTIALSYKVEDEYVQNAVGVFGRRLEVYSYLIHAQSTMIHSLHHLLKSRGFYINGMLFDSHAQSQVLLTESESKQGAVIIDIGGSCTKVSFIKHQKLNQSLVIPIGGNVLTKDIATCLKVSIPEAERIKILYGNISLDQIDTDESIEILTLNEGKKQISTLLVCQIIESRIRELLLYCLKQMPALSESSYPVVIGGGGALLKGIVPFIQKNLNCTSRSGVIESISPMIDSISYACSIGMVLFAIKTKAISYVPQKSPLISWCKAWAQKHF